VSQLPLPYQAHSDTSHSAAESMRALAGRLRARVYACIVSHGAAGLTDEEIQAELEMQGSTQRPRRVELVRAGLVVDSGLRRRTTAWRSAVVWKGATR